MYSLNLLVNYPIPDLRIRHLYDTYGADGVETLIEKSRTIYRFWFRSYDKAVAAKAATNVRWYEGERKFIG